MNINFKKQFAVAIMLLAIFVGFTALVACVDLQPVGPDNTRVGFATLNKSVFDALGTSDTWYSVTEVLGLLAILEVGLFGLWGLIQLIKRKSLFRVDHRILMLALLYAAVAIAYLLFEIKVVNYRPILVDGALEASYPSSHTMLSVTVAVSSAMALHGIIPEKKGLILAVDLLSAAIAAVMVVGRLLSGVHWLTDVIGGALLSAALCQLYYATVKLVEAKRPRLFFGAEKGHPKGE